MSDIVRDGLIHLAVLLLDPFYGFTFHSAHRAYEDEQLGVSVVWVDDQE